MEAERTRWRRLSQFAVALFYLLLPFAHRFDFHAVAGNLASLRLGPIDLNEPAAAASAVAASRELTWSLVVGTLPVFLLALLLGPVFCSWICPWGLLSEGIDRIRQHFRPSAWSSTDWKRLRKPRALILAAFLLLSLFSATPLIALFSAPRLISTLPLEAIFFDAVSPVTGGLLLVLLLLEILGPRRLWCRALCPVGILAGYLRTKHTASILFSTDRCFCPHAPLCQTACPWGIDPRHMASFDGCTNCLACVDQCPSTALRFQLVYFFRT